MPSKARPGLASFPMINNADPFSLKTHCTGVLAERALSCPARGRVAALFKSSFYIQINGIFVCIGPTDFARGPLNITTTAPATTSWLASGLTLADQVQLINRRLTIGARLQIHITPGTIWQPAARSAAGLCDDGLQVLEAYARSHQPKDGLAPLLYGASNPVLAQAKAAVAELKSWLTSPYGPHRPMAAPPAAVTELLGLGPGLTPSGDDFLAALLIALRWLGQTERACALAAAVCPRALAASNPISAQHLYAAAEGWGSAALHDLLRALCTTDATKQLSALDRLSAVGHTSGWDALAGLYVTLQVHHPSRIAVAA